jgi:hypothetical protein
MQPIGLARGLGSSTNRPFGDPAFGFFHALAIRIAQFATLRFLTRAFPGSNPPAQIVQIVIGHFPN